MERPRIHHDPVGRDKGAELRDEGIRAGRKRVARLMLAAGLRGVSRRTTSSLSVTGSVPTQCSPFTGLCTTIRQATARPAPDLVERNFTAAGPNRLWVADITYLPTWTGTLYLAVVIDAWSRRVAQCRPVPCELGRYAHCIGIGWAMETHLRTELVMDALSMALRQRRPTEVIHHSDQGSQYTSFAFGKRCRDADVRPSMGSVGDCFDNALCESFFATLECELLDRSTIHSPAEARRAVFEFIEGWYPVPNELGRYNPHRRHSALAYHSPIQYEMVHAIGA